MISQMVEFLDIREMARLQQTCSTLKNIAADRLKERKAYCQMLIAEVGEWVVECDYVSESE